MGEAGMRVRDIVFANNREREESAITSCKNGNICGRRWQESAYAVQVRTNSKTHIFFL